MTAIVHQCAYTIKIHTDTTKVSCAIVLKVIDKLHTVKQEECFSVFYQFLVHSNASGNYIHDSYTHCFYNYPNNTLIDVPVAANDRHFGFDIIKIACIL